MDLKEIKKDTIKAWQPEQEQEKQKQILQRIQDLEYERWWLHQNRVQNLNRYFKSTYPTKEYWNEFGAFVFSSARQTGKTTLLHRIVLELLQNGEKCIILTPYMSMVDNIKKHFNCDGEYDWSDREETLKIQTLPFDGRGLNLNQWHLFCDEVTDTKNLFDYDWKSISIFKMDI